MNIANKVTMFRICCIPFIFSLAYLPSTHHWCATFLLYVLACISDYFDGWIARKKHLVTDFGKFMDPISDKCLVVTSQVILLDFCIGGELVLIVTTMREFLVSGIRMISGSKNVVIQANKLGKIKTFLQMFSFGIVFFFLMVLEESKNFSIQNVLVTHDILTLIYSVLSWIVLVVTVVSGVKYWIIGLKNCSK